MSRIIVLLLSLTILFADMFALDCIRENEEYKCGSACQTTCSTLGQNCPIVNIRCNDACYCKEGYARKGVNNSECIPTSECLK